MYLSPFLYSFLITAVAASLVSAVCSKNPLSKARRLGGVAIILGFFGAIFFDNNLIISQNLWGIIIVSVFILVFGIHDDFMDLDWKTQFLFQVAVAVLVFILGVRAEYITNPAGGLIFLNTGKYLLPSLVFGILWIVLMINSMNWIDGIDGLSGGVALIGVLTIFFLSQRPEVNQPPVGIMSMALSGAFLSFLVFNFYPSRILAGTTGSMFMGFIMAVLAIFAGTKIATALLVMAVPVVDAFWVIGERVRSGKSIFKADNRHLHHKLLELGWSPRRIAVFFYGVTACISVIAINTRAMGKIITFSSVVVLMVLILFYMDKKLKRSGKNYGVSS